jgi:hypothetical protein
MNRLARHDSVGLLAISCGLLVSCAAEGPLAPSGGDLPERLRIQVAPGPAASWRAPDLRGYSNALRPTERVPIDPAREYDLLELIDVAQRVKSSPPVRQWPPG